jgi:general secretion pathway protein L
MAEWLILRLARSAESDASWMLADGEGRPLSPAQSGALSTAVAAATGRKLAVLVPANQALCTSVALPQGGAARTPQVVAYALEEHLVAEVESQHFAVGRSSGGTQVPVVVVARSTMEGWLAELASAALSPDLMVVDAALLPRYSGYAVALLEGESLMITDASGVTSSLSAPAGGFATALQIALGEQAAATALLFHATPLDWQRRSAEIEATRPTLASLKVQLLSTGVLPWLAAQLHSAAPINLLQGDYQQRRGGTAQWQRWRLAATLAAALLGLHLGVQGFRLWSLDRSERELDTRIGQLVAPVQDALAHAGAGSTRARLERLLAGAAGNDAAGLLPAMQVLAQAMNGMVGARIEALNFHDGSLQLKLRAGDAQAMERIMQSLRSAGWPSELVSSRAAGDAYEGEIQVHGRNS